MGLELGVGVDALVSQRSRGQFAYRAVSRVYGVNAALPTGRWPARAAALAAGLAVDTASWAVLRRSQALGFGPRLALDVADVWVASRRVERSPEAAMLIGVPLAAEAAVRRGAVGLVVPAVHYTVATLTRRHRGRPTPIGSVGPQIQGAGMGLALAGYSRHLRRNAVARRAQADAARVEAARLAGQHEVAMATESVVDRLAAIEYLAAVADDRPVGPARCLARWKASLATQAASESSYLRVVLGRWEAANRTSSLQDDPVLVVDEGAGSLVLTRGQAQQLHEALDALALQGRHEVHVEPTTGHRLPGRAVRLRIREWTVDLGADAPVGPAVDLAAPMVTVGAGRMLSLMTSGHGDAPAAIVGGGAAASVALGLWTHRATNRPDPIRPEILIGAAVGLATGQALVAGPLLRRPADHDGVQVIPAVITLMAPAFLAGRYHGALHPRGRAMVAGLFAAGVGGSLLTSPRPIDPRALAVGIGELLVAYLIWSRVQSALEDDKARLQDELDDRSDAAAGAAFDDGRRRVLAMVTAEIERLAADAARLDAADPVCAEIEQRLTDVRRELKGLG